MGDYTKNVKNKKLVKGFIMRKGEGEG